MDDPLGRVADEGPAEPLPLVGAIDRETPEERDRNGVWHVAPKAARRRSHIDAAGGKGEVPTTALASVVT
jgi:hypothetical protein